MTGSRVRVFRRVLVGMLIVSTLMLSGCARPARGQSMASAEAAINAVEGLSGTADSTGTYAGWVYQRWSTVDVVLDAGYTVLLPNLFIEWLIMMGWSMNDDKPNRGVSAQIEFDDLDGLLRWQSLFEESALDPHFHVRTRDEEEKPRVVISVWITDLDRGVLGPWPGEVPVLPENVVVKIADE